jgi:CRP-like cAMP-binding protein
MIHAARKANWKDGGCSCGLRSERAPDKVAPLFPNRDQKETMSESKVDVRGVLTRLPLFRQLSVDEIDSLARGTREQKVAKNEFLFQKGDPSHGFFVIAHGQIKLAFPSPQGAEKVVEIIGAGQSFGEAVMFMEKPFPVYAQALADSLLLHIAKPVIFLAIEHDPALARKMLAGLSIRLHGLIQDVEAYSLRSGTQRLIGFLLEQPRTATDRGAEIALPASKNVIASRLNLTPETLSRILHALTERGLIDVHGRVIVAHDIERLRNFES